MNWAELWTVLLTQLPKFLLNTRHAPLNTQEEIEYATAQSSAVMGMLQVAHPQNFVGQWRLDQLRASLFRNVVTLTTSVARMYNVSLRRGMVFDYVRNKTKAPIPAALHPPYVHVQRAIETWNAVQDDFYYAWNEVEEWAESADRSAVRLLRLHVRGSAICPRNWARPLNHNSGAAFVEIE